MRTTLLADIGGSKSRFALANPAGAPARMSVIENDTVADLDAAVARYLEETGARPRAATIAVAGRFGEREPALATADIGEKARTHRGYPRLITIS